MSKWVTEELENILKGINEVPYTDDRESQQLTIIMNGFAQLNNKVMDKASAKTKKAFRGWNLDAEKGPIGEASHEDASADELTRLRPIR